MDKQQELEQLFNAAKNQQTVFSFDETKKSFLDGIEASKSSIPPKKKSFFSLKNWIIMITLISTIAISLFFTSNNDSIKSSLKESIAKQQTNKAEQNYNSTKETYYHEIFENTLLEDLPVFELDTNDLQVVLSTDIDKKEESIRPTLPKLNWIPPTFQDEYVFPKLTEDEIKANNKQKKAMLKALEKFDKKSYAFLVSGSFDFNGKMTSVQSFIIQKTEVSNIEYRTFLFDLLIQGRKDDFLKAKPDQNQWNLLPGGENNKMKDHYFSHPAYDNYPVVNISREGAEMYCKWLTQEVYKILFDKKKSQFNDIRLPAREEWVMAASVEGKKGPYPWGGPFTKNSEGLILANYRRPIEDFDSIPFMDFSDVTAPVESYFPNDFGLYNMSGNVAEMVYNDIETKAAGTAGGGWRNSEEEIKILGPDPYPGVTTPNPGIGFRVVMTVK